MAIYIVCMALNAATAIIGKGSVIGSIGALFAGISLACIAMKMGWLTL